MKAMKKVVQKNVRGRCDGPAETKRFLDKLGMTKERPRNKMRGGVAMAVENWFFGRAARKIIFEGRWPSEIRAVLRTMMKVREGVARAEGIWFFAKPCEK